MLADSDAARRHRPRAAVGRASAGPAGPAARSVIAQPSACGGAEGRAGGGGGVGGCWTRTFMSVARTMRIMRRRTSREFSRDSAARMLILPRLDSVSLGLACYSISYHALAVFAEGPSYKSSSRKNNS